MKNKKTSKRKKGTVVVYKTEEQKKKSLKRSITWLCIGVFAVLIICVSIIVFMTFDVKNSFYPTEMFPEENGLTLYSNEEKTYTLRPLPESAYALQELGTYEIYPIVEEQRYEFGSDVYATVATSVGEKLHIVKGSGNIVADIEAYTGEYYNFVGKIEPVFKTKNSGSGVSDSGAYVSWVTGDLDSGNLFWSGDIQVVALTVNLHSASYVSMIYATTDASELLDAASLLRQFVNVSVIENVSEQDSITDKVGIENVSSEEESQGEDTYMSYEELQEDMKKLEEKNKTAQEDEFLPLQVEKGTVDRAAISQNGVE